jgi:hypothetical protein
MLIANAWSFVLAVAVALTWIAACAKLFWDTVLPVWLVMITIALNMTHAGHSERAVCIGLATLQPF